MERHHPLLLFVQILRAILYFPCSCTPDLSIDNDPHITLICDKLNLTDLKMSDILDAFLTKLNVSKILRLALPGNKLTRLPDQIRLITRLIHVDLEDNHIETIHSRERSYLTSISISFS